jgi:hypothetical protein
MIFPDGSALARSGKSPQEVDDVQGRFQLVIIRESFFIYLRTPKNNGTHGNAWPRADAWQPGRAEWTRRLSAPAENAGKKKRT